MICTLCHMKEENTDPGVRLLVCSSCTQKLLRMPQNELMRGYKLALEKGLLKKASALEMFMQPETLEGETHGKNKRIITERPDRKRSLRIVRSKEKSNWRPQKKERPSLYRSKQNRSAVL